MKPAESLGGETARASSQTVRAQLALREIVLSGAFAPGERLPEIQLVERIGVSRTPVRAALMSLAEEGLVEPLPGGGYAAKAFSRQDILDAVEVRGTMEGLAARLAAERGVDSARMAVLHALLADLDVIVGSLNAADPGAGEGACLGSEAGFGAYVSLNGTFHRMIAGLADSPIVDREVMRATTLPFASPSAFVSAQAQLAETPGILRLAQDQHHAIVDAIFAREGTRAEALMREHARLAIRSFDLARTSRPILAAVPGAALIRDAGR